MTVQQNDILMTSLMNQNILTVTHSYGQYIRLKFKDYKLLKNKKLIN